ncbi:MAG: D-glycero-alpha-D-manno-heptose-1,7-bisphosphate 7-phosphatase [Rickettsiales bacterium]
MLVLLDRDGVINKDGPEGVLRFEEFVLLPHAIEGIVKLTKAGFNIAVCTNQSAIGMGKTTHAIVHQVHDHMSAEVEKAGGKIDEIYYASEAPNEFSRWRKPAPGMLLAGIKKFNADPARTPFVGDMLRDMEAALTAGCPRILTRTGKGASIEAKGIPAHLQPLTVTDNLLTAAELIIAAYR